MLLCFSGIWNTLQGYALDNDIAFSHIAAQKFEKPELLFVRKEVTYQIRGNFGGFDYS